MLFVLLQTIGLKAQESRFKEGETLNVWASSGLNMRDKPDAKAAKVSTIPYGAKVVVQPNIGLKIPFEVEEFKGFTVKGYWLLVKYGNTEGFVFDGFLSRLPAPKKEKLNFEAYFNDNFKKVDSHFNLRIYSDTSGIGVLIKDFNKVKENSICSYSQKYGYGIVYNHSVCQEIGLSEKVEIPNISLYEGLFLIKFYFSTEESVDTWNKFQFESKTNSILFESRHESGGCFFSIQKKGNKIFIDGGCAC